MAASWSLAVFVQAAVRPLTSRQAVGCGDPLSNYDAPQFARGLRERVEHRRNSIIVGAASMRIAFRHAHSLVLQPCRCPNRPGSILPIGAMQPGDPFIHAIGKSPAEIVFPSFARGERETIRNKTGSNGPHRATGARQFATGKRGTLTSCSILFVCVWQALQPSQPHCFRRSG